MTDTPHIQLVDKELAAGLISGSDYGSQVRLLVRSPTRLLFLGVGCTVFRRDQSAGGWHALIKVFSERCTKDKLAAGREIIDREIEPGITDHVLEAWRLGKTVLIDGGGEKMRIPRKLASELAHADYASWTINAQVPLTGRIPTCLQCGKDLQPRFVVHQMGKTILPDHPRGLEDCQKLTNRQVVAIHDYGINRPDLKGYVEWFDTWDGESVFDPHFCGNTCAAKFGRRAAAEGLKLEPNVEPEQVVWTHEGVSHAAPEEPRFIEGAGGLKVRIA